MRLYCTEELHATGGNGTFLLGRAEEQLKALTRDYANSVQLIYLDPPFHTGDSFKLKIGRGKQAKTVLLYDDNLTVSEYVAWMRRILTACRVLLNASGSIYLHVDYRMSGKMRSLLDEIFGESNFMNEIIWSYKSGGRSTRYYPRKHDTILFYRKSRAVYFDIRAVGVPRGTERRNHMKRFVDADGRVGFSIRSNGKLYTYYEDALVFPSDVWTDIEHLQQRDSERNGYATQKPEALLRRILLASSKEGDLVMDLFSGSGTTATVAAKCNRRFLTVDASPVAMYMLRKRLLSVSSERDLFDQSEQSFSLVYPPDKTPCRVDCEVVLRKGVCTLKLQNAVFDETPMPLVYCAVGTVQKKCFCAVANNCAPKLPLTLPLPASKTPVLQVVNALGQQAFFTIDA